MPLAPNTLPARAFQRSTRTSRLLFHYRAADLSLTPVTGETPTFVRATAGGLVLDSRGYYRDVAQAQPRWEMGGYNGATGLWETPGLLLEGQRTNLVPYNDALTAANGWTLTGAPTVAANYSRLGALSFSRVSGLDGAKDVRRTVGLTGDGVKGVSFVVRFDGAGTTRHFLYDVTAAAYRAAVTVTWAADGTATCVANTGTLLAFEARPDHAYRILMASTACTAANAHIIGPVGDSGTATSVQAGGVQVEDAAFPSSIIPTPAGGTVTRDADALSFATGLTGLSSDTDDVTIYVKLTRPVYYAIGASAGILQLSTAGARYYLGSVAAVITSRWNNGSAFETASAAWPNTDVIEIIAQLTDLTTAGKQRLDVGSGFGAYTATVAGVSALGNGTLRCGYADDFGTSLNSAIQVLKIARGLKTMADMREVF